MASIIWRFSYWLQSTTTLIQQASTGANNNEP